MKRGNPYPKGRLVQVKRSRSEVQPLNDRARAIDIQRAAAAMDGIRKSTDRLGWSGAREIRKWRDVGNHVSLEN